MTNSSIDPDPDLIIVAVNEVKSIPIVLTLYKNVVYGECAGTVASQSYSRWVIG